MTFSVVFLAILALGAAVPQLPKQQAADQTLLKKQHQIILLLENIAGEIPNTQLLSIGQTYDIESNLQAYENPNLVKLLATAVKTGNVQPKGTVLSFTVSQLRQEVVLLTRILLGAKDYETFLNTAAWARVHLNECQFGAALITAVLQRPDTQGIILPPLYEIVPQYFFDARVIQEVQNIKQTGVRNLSGGKDIIIPINYTSHLPPGEHKIAYFTEDIGLNTWYAWLGLTGTLILELDVLQQGSGSGIHGHTTEAQTTIGHGAQWIYLQQQLLARYNLERLGNGLGPIPELNLNLVDIPLKTHLTYANGLEMPGRPSGPIDVSAIRPELTKLVRTLEKRIIAAIDCGHIITPEGSLLSLYQPQGLNILGNLIEGSGRSINPRYYGSLLQASKVLLGGTPQFSNIWEYTPSALEVGPTAARDPALYVLLKQIYKLVQKYQESLPSYQYNDIVLPGVQIEKIDVSELVTYFQDYIVNLDNAGIVGVNEQIQQQQQQGELNIKGLLKRLDHKPYDIEIVVQSQNSIANAVVRVFLGPKFDHERLPIDINTNREEFVELDQWVVDLVAGQNVITRNSQLSSIQGMDLPSVDQIREQVEGAIQSQTPLYITQPQQVFGFPARLSLPKGTYGGLPLQLLVVISAGQQQLHYGPIIPDDVNSFHSNQWQVVSPGQYEQIVEQPAKGEGLISVDVVPDLEELGVGINQGKWKWTDLYNRYQGYYSQPQWFNLQQSWGIGQGVGQGLGVGGSLVGGGIGQGIGVGQGTVGGQGIVGQGGVGGQGILGQGIVGGQGIGGQHIVGGQGIGGQGVLGGQGIRHGQGVSGLGVGGLSGGLGQQLGGGVRGVQGGRGGLSGVRGGVASGLGGLSGGLGQILGGGVGGVQGGVGSGVGGIGSGVVSPMNQKSAAIVQQHYNSLPISQVIGGAISLDGKPLGWPLDRPLGPSVWSVPNMAVRDVLVYHQDVPVTQVVGSQ